MKNLLAVETIEGLFNDTVFGNRIEKGTLV